MQFLCPKRGNCIEIFNPDRFQRRFIIQEQIELIKIRAKFRSFITNCSYLWLLVSLVNKNANPEMINSDHTADSSSFRSLS